MEWKRILSVKNLGREIPEISVGINLGAITILNDQETKSGKPRNCETIPFRDCNNSETEKTAFCMNID